MTHIASELMWLKKLLQELEYTDVSAYRLSLSEDTKALNQLNSLIQEGKEMASVLYTYRSCVKALPQVNSYFRFKNNPCACLVLFVAMLIKSTNSKTDCLPFLFLIEIFLVINMWQLPDSMKQSQADLYLETYQVLDLEMSRLREIQRWQASAASKLAADMQRFSRPERRINGPTITHLWYVLSFLLV
ncbi:Protein PIR [Vitis vinifera]|uniref:Protein PIR n=1 Tax=Vitis vinifera TaxID=29760 RepID=A0A438EIW6_VITVI|nr:Protein PIR [Vitis vinifera]